MTSHLVSLSIGPVQDFIAQARRSRDLWFGSHILSEISRSAAKAVAENGGKLIFPALQLDDPELDACDGMMRNDTHQPPLAIANKILFEADDADSDVDLSTAETFYTDDDEDGFIDTFGGWTEQHGFDQALQEFMNG